MPTSVYQVNKGINKPIEFKGLKAQYIWYLAGGLVGLLIVFALMYLIGVGVFVSLPIIIVLGSVLFLTVYRMSNKYGEHGIMKKMAKGSIPKCIKCYSRMNFIQLTHRSKN